MKVDNRICCILWIHPPYSLTILVIPTLDDSVFKVDAAGMLTPRPVCCHRFSSRTTGLSQGLLCRSANRRDIENSNISKEHAQGGMPAQRAIHRTACLESSGTS